MTFHYSTLHAHKNRERKDKIIRQSHKELEITIMLCAFLPS